MVLFVTYSGLLGGAERLLLDFGSAVQGEPCLACPPGPLADAARERGFRVFPLRRRALYVRGRPRDRVLGMWRLLTHARETRALACALDPDVLVTWGARSAIAAMAAGLPYVFQHNDLLPGPLIGTAVRAASRRARRVIVPSAAVAAELPQRGRVVVIAPGVDVEAFDDSPSQVDPPEVLVLGAIVAWKRPELALEACALARRRLAGIRLRLVGDVLDRDRALLRRLQGRAGEPDLAGAVEFAGFESDPRGALARSSCLLHCAPREPFGLAVLEALAAGRPAIVPASGGPAEIVEPSCGVLYRPGDAAAAAQALVEVLSDPRRAAEMGKRGRQRARARFDGAAARARFAAEVASARRSRSAGPQIARQSLALVTVTHNSAAELRRLLSSVERHLASVRVVVVDCGSSDQTVAIASRWGFVRTIGLSSNIGFGAGCNRGLASISEPVSVLLNPDVELFDDSLLSLAAEAMRGERLLAPLVLSPDGSRQDTVHPIPGSARDLARALLPERLVPRGVRSGGGLWRASAPRRVGWAVGCALAARTETLRRLGPFDERIFLYGEDLELGLRAAEAGIESWFWPDARVLHHRAHATSVAFGGEPFELLAAARHEAVLRRLGPRRARLDDAVQAATFATRIVGKPLLGRSAARERRQLRALWTVTRPGAR